MGANRPLATPEAYPSAFLSAVRDGGAVLYTDDLPWTPGSTAKRFRIFIALLRSLPHHELHAAATRVWHVSTSKRAIVLRVTELFTPESSMAAPLISMALKIGVNPNGAQSPTVS